MARGRKQVHPAFAICEFGHEQDQRPEQRAEQQRQEKHQLRQQSDALLQEAAFFFVGDHCAVPSGPDPPASWLMFDPVCYGASERHAPRVSAAA